MPAEQPSDSEQEKQIHQHHGTEGKRARGQIIDTSEAESRLLTFCRRFVANAAEDAWASHQAALSTGASDIYTWDEVRLSTTALPCPAALYYRLPVFLTF